MILSEPTEGTYILNSTGSMLKWYTANPVECPTEAVIDSIRLTTFTSLVVSGNPTGDLRKPDLLKFSLYPR